jgi:hypothetical protein
VFTPTTHVLGTGSLQVVASGSGTSSWTDTLGNPGTASNTFSITEDTRSLTIAFGQTLTLSGDTLTVPTIELDGTILIQSNNPSTIITSAITGTGLIEIKNNTALEIDGSVGSGLKVKFDLGGGVPPELVLDDPSDFHATIQGFQGKDQIHLIGMTPSQAAAWAASITFENFTGTLKFTSDGGGGTIVSDPPASTTTVDASSTTTDASTTTADASSTTTDASTTTTDATVIPAVETTTLTTTETTGSHANVTTVDGGTVVAPNTAVLDPDGGQMTNMTSGNGTVVDATGTVSESASFTVNFGATLESSSISHEIVGTLTDNGTVEVTSGKLEIAGTPSGTGVLKIDAGATLQLDDSNAINVTFAGSNGTLILDHSLTQSFSAVMSGLRAGDTIDLKDLVFTSGHMTATASFVDGNTKVVVNNTSTAQSVTLTLAGDYTHSTWDFAQDSGTGSILHNLPATNADAFNLNVPGSASADFALTVSAALTIPDQFAFQDDSQSGTFAIGSASIASGKDASATHAVTLDKTDNQPTGTATTTGPADSDLTSKVAMNAHPATGDTSNGTQAGTMSQTASASPAATGPNGSDTFVFSANLGHETLTNFHPASDVIEIDHTVFADVHALLAATHDDGHGNAVITTDPHDSVTLKNVTVAQLVQHQGDFHFT